MNKGRDSNVSVDYEVSEVSDFVLFLSKLLAVILTEVFVKNSLDKKYYIFCVRV